MRRIFLSLFLIALFASPSWAVTCSTSWARSKDWGSSEVLTEPDLEGEFDNTNTLGSNCGSILGTHDHDNAGTDKLNAHASVVALSIKAGLISTEVATSHQALVAQGDGTAGWVTAVITSGESQGDVLYFDGSVWAKLGAGTSGEFLKTQGASANPTWADAAVSAAHASKIWDADVNTIVEVEQAADQDVIRFTVDGVEQLLIDSDGIKPQRSCVDTGCTPVANTIYKESVVKGWVSINGTGVSINQSFNVSGVVGNATGDYTVSWDTNFANGNYAVVGTCMGDDTNDRTWLSFANGSAPATGTTNVVCVDQANGKVDVTPVTVIAVGVQ